MDARIITLLNGLGYKTVSADYYSKIDLWDAWYRGPVEEFHKFKLWNGTKYVHLEKMCAGMAKKVSEDWADLCMSEKVEIILDGQKEQDFWNQVSEANNFKIMANRYEELAFALGTSAIVARVSGVEVDGQGSVIGDGARIKLDFITANNIFPLSWQNGIVTECAFCNTKTVKGVPYLYLQIHKLNDNGTYDIENRLFSAEDGALTAVNLFNVKGFENIPEIFHTNQKEPLFVLNYPNLANSIDYSCPLGISVYANAIDQLKTVDNAFDSFNNEIVLSRKRIAVKAEMMKGVKGEQVFDTNDVVFYYLPEDSQPGSSIQDLSSSMRIGELYQAVQMALNSLSLKTGLGSNRWKFDAGQMTTATQVMSANSDAFRTLKKHELVLDGVLKNLVKIVLRLGNAFLSAGLNENVDVSVDFDDSIIEDTSVEFERDCRMLAMGVISREEFRAKYRDESVKEAKRNLPQIEELTEQLEEE